MYKALRSTRKVSLDQAKPKPNSRPKQSIRRVICINTQIQEEVERPKDEKIKFVSNRHNRHHHYQPFVPSRKKQHFPPQDAIIRNNSFSNGDAAKEVPTSQEPQTSMLMTVQG